MRHFIKFHEEAKRIVNGKVVEDSMINSEYNGKKLHVDERHNNTFKHFIINDKDIKHLLNRRSNKMNLLNRLEADYSKTKKNKKNKKNIKKNKIMRKHIRSVRRKHLKKSN